MDEIGEFIAGLASKQEPQYQEIGQKALERWIETETISPKMARWIRRSAKFKGMKMPVDLRALIGDDRDDAHDDDHRDMETGVSSGGSRSPVYVVVFEELSLAFAKAADRLRQGVQPQG